MAVDEAFRTATDPATDEYSFFATLNSIVGFASLFAQLFLFSHVSFTRSQRIPASLVPSRLHALSKFILSERRTTL